jgi:hypothetical protein
MEQQTIISLVMGLIAVVTNFVTTKIQLQHLKEKVEQNEEMSNKADEEIDKHMGEGFARVKEIENKLAVLEEKNLQTLTNTTAEQKFVTKEVLDLKLKHIELTINHIGEEMSDMKENIKKILDVLNQKEISQ